MPKDETDDNGNEKSQQQKQTFDKQNTSGDNTTPNNESATSYIA